MTIKALVQSPTLRAFHARLERRVHRRRKANFPTVIVTDQGEAEVHLLDVSTHGARGYATSPPRTGVICDLALYGQRVSAEAVWVNFRSFGLRFVEPISGDLVKQLCAQNGR